MEQTFYKLKDKYGKELKCPNVITETYLYNFDPFKPH